MFIEQPAVYLRWLYPKALWRMDRHERAVYLTFDDGPIPEATPFILEVLRTEGIKATFFVVGDNVRKYPELFQQILDEGHCVGNHTHNHIGGLRHTIKEYSYNVEKANAYIHSKLMRPPHGWMRLSQYAWLSRKFKVVIRYARNGSIITFHDSLKSIDKLRTALPQSIKWLKEQGYAFKTFNI